MHKALLQLLEFLLSPNLQGIYATGRKNYPTSNQQYIQKYLEIKKILHMHTVGASKRELMWSLHAFWFSACYLFSSFSDTKEAGPEKGNPNCYGFVFSKGLASLMAP